MSISRQNFLDDLKDIADAVALEAVASASTVGGPPPGVAVLRRGMMVASLVTLEAFIRARTEELLVRLGGWPASFNDLPQKFRDAALLHALPALNRYAIMMKRQQQDYESEIIVEVLKMSKNTGPVFEFSKFIAGDFTGNISDTSIRELVSMFQVQDCWNSFRLLSAEVGFGTPSVHELVKEIVSKRHKSAHVHGYVPTTSDITKLPLDLLCVGLCFDIAMTATVEQALSDWQSWSGGETNWRDGVKLYTLMPDGTKFKVRRQGAARALRIVATEADGAAFIPLNSPGEIAVMVVQDSALQPISWRVKS